MWTHATFAEASERRPGRRGARLLDWWWQLQAPAADGGPPSPAGPDGSSELTLLRVQPPEDILGTQVDGRFELHAGTAVTHRTRRFAPARTRRAPSRPDAVGQAGQ